jgi:NAD(P)H dehydrogenase (quinone)
VTLTELAAIISDVTGKPVSYTDVPIATFAGILVGAGVPEAVAGIFADVDRSISEGELDVDPTDLAALLGRPATPAADAIKIALSE